MSLTSTISLISGWDEFCWDIKIILMGLSEFKRSAACMKVLIVFSPKMKERVAAAPYFSKTKFKVNAWQLPLAAMTQFQGNGKKTENESLNLFFFIDLYNKFIERKVIMFKAAALIVILCCLTQDKALGGMVNVCSNIKDCAGCTQSYVHIFSFREQCR